MIRKIVFATSVLCILVGTTATIALAVTNEQSVWQNNGLPTIQKVADLQSNTLPSSSNFDCINTTTRKFGSNTPVDDCLTATAVGQVCSNGVTFAGTNQQIRVDPPFPYFNLIPIPNQEMMMSYSSAPIDGLNIGFYKTIRDKLPAVPQYLGNNSWKYVLNQYPELGLNGPDGKSAPANIYSLAFSKNGNWMVVDLLGKGIVRVNLATFEMQPIAPSLYSSSTGARQAQIAISNDGRSVILKPSNFDYFKVFDVGHCDASMQLPVQSGTVPCPTRDFYPELKNQITGLKSIYQPRFVNDSQISFTAIYDFSPNDYEVANYQMTAPGVSASGIQYLGMGDSFASGEGALSYTSDTDDGNNTCHLSSKSYAYVFKQQLFESAASVACSGAKTEDIVTSSDLYKGQVRDNIRKQDRSNDAIDNIKSNYIPGFIAQSEFVDQYRPDAVTISIGGNDIGFNGIVESCVSPVSRPKACYPTYEDRQELNQRINGQFDNLVATYSGLLKPGKRVYVTGYPQIAVSNGSCGVNVHLETSEIEMSSDLIDYLNATIERAAHKAGVRYVDISQALAGHRLCETNSANIAVNGMTAGGDKGVGPVKFIGTESYHPNALGHQLLASVIRAKTNNLTQPMPGADSALQAPGQPSSLDARGLPKSGRSINLQVYNDGLAPSELTPGQSTTLSQSNLKPGTSYKISIGDTQVAIAAADSVGSLSLSVPVPAGQSTGFQPITIDGVNQLGQPLQITKTVYVGGVACTSEYSSGQDSDQDGIDDGCDGMIGPPPPVKLSGLTSGVTLTDNSISITLTRQ